MAIGLFGKIGNIAFMQLLTLLAKCGNVDAMTTLGARYSDQKQYGLAIKWWRKAAGLKFPAAQFFIGVAFDFGNGVEQDKAEAVKWYRLAAEQGDGAAQHVLGACYLQGDGCEKNIPEALRWYRAAAEQGDRATQIALGGMYASGRFIAKGQSEPFTQDQSEAVRWYSSAFNAYSLTAEIAQQYASEFKWFLWAADAGNSDVLLNVANIYSSSNGAIPQDHAEALRWYKMAAEKGSEVALCQLGRIYEKGDGVPQDYAEAMRWYKVPAEMGNAGAMFNIAMMYNRNEGVALNPEDLYFWFSLCSKAVLPDEQAGYTKKALKTLKTKLTIKSIAEIEERESDWVRTHPKIHFLA